MSRRRTTCALLLLATAAPATLPAARPASQQLLTHAFSAAAAPDAELRLRPIAGRVHQVQGKGGVSVRDPHSLVDDADYRDAGTLRLSQAVSLGPPGGGGPLVAPGEYGVSLLPSASGLPVLVLRGADGRALRLVLAAASRPAAPVDHLLAESFSSDVAGPWVIAFHVPTASGLLVISPEGTAATGLRPASPAAAAAVAPPANARAVAPAGVPRRRTRADLIQERLEQRRQRIPPSAPSGPSGATPRTLPGATPKP